MRGGLAAAALVPVLALAACDGVPAGLERSDRDAYEAAVASLECRLVTEEDYLAVEFQTALDREQVLGLTRSALAAKRAVKLEGGGVQLTEGPCAKT